MKKQKPIRTSNHNIRIVAAEVIRMLRENPEMSVAEAARTLGISYYAAYRYARGHCKALSPIK